MMPGMAWLLYLLLGLSLLALTGAALLFWQQAPPWNKIPGTQKRRELTLQEMAAPAQILWQQEPSLDPKPILELPLLKLAQKLRTEELSLVLKVHQEVNRLMDFLGKCEEQLQALKKLKKSERGLLYRVPTGLKDPFDCMQQPLTSARKETSSPGEELMS